MNKESPAQASDRLEIVTMRSFEEIEAIRAIWEQMRAHESIPALNADIDRYLSVATSLEGRVQPHIIILYRNDDPKAMIIGRVEKRQIKCRVGYKTIFKRSLRCLSVVYGGILGELSEQICLRLVQELLDTLKRGNADVVHLNHLDIDSCIYRLSRTMPCFLCRDHFPVVEDHWQTNVPGTAKEFYAGIRRKRKKEWNRLSRRLEDAAGGPVKVECYENANQVEHFVEVAARISNMTYKDALDAGFSDSASTHSLLAQAAERGRWRAYVLYAGQVPCAYETGIVYGRVYFAEAIGFSPEWGSFSPGTILFVKALEDLSQNTPVEIFDYGFGSAGYKERFGSKSWPEASVYIFAPRFCPVMINILRSSVRNMNANLQFVVKKMGYLRWIKRHWRNLLQAKNPESKCGVGR
jgi:hypothetical protein